MSERRLRVVLVDDHAMVRSGLRQTLSEHGGPRVTGEARNRDLTCYALKNGLIQ